MRRSIEEAKFRSRRGLNELDLLLAPFSKQALNNLSEDELDLYLELMSWEDNDLADVILYGKRCEGEKLQSIVLKIINFFDEI